MMIVVALKAVIAEPRDSRARSTYLLLLSAQADPRCKTLSYIRTVSELSLLAFTSQSSKSGSSPSSKFLAEFEPRNEKSISVKGWCKLDCTYFKVQQSVLIYGSEIEGEIVLLMIQEVYRGFAHTFGRKDVRASCTQAVSAIYAAYEARVQHSTYVFHGVHSEQGHGQRSFGTQTNEY